jgi:bifunctional non-homologous end joining protein LigD
MFYGDKPDSIERSDLVPERVGKGRATRMDVKNIEHELISFGAPRREIDPARLEVMKAETAPAPFDRPGWLFELKYDGYRLLIEKRGSRARLSTRHGRDITAGFPEIERAVLGLPFESLLLDGELVVPDGAGRPSFERLQRRAQRTRRADALRAAAASPSVVFAFDLLAYAGFDLRSLPLDRRKALLRAVLPDDSTTPLRYVDDVRDRGKPFFAAVAAMGLEGIVGKRVDSAYRSGYSSSWLKVRADRTEDFAVVGYRPAARGFSRLHLAARNGSGLVYTGSVGTGFSVAEMTHLLGKLAPRRRATPAFAGLGTGERGDVWVDPELVVEVRFKEWTSSGRLRQPVFLRRRDDKTPADCRRRPDPGAG